MSIKENVEGKQAWESLLSDKRNTHKVKVHKFDTDKLTLVAMGDEHLGSRFYNADEHKRNVDWCYKEKASLILMGDQMETATKTSVGAGVFEQNEVVQQQLDSVCKIYKPLADEGLILGNHIGNHEARLHQHSSINISEIFAKLIGIDYLGVGAISYLKVGNQSYVIYSTHGASATRLPHTKIRAALQLANMVDADIYLHGHLHSLDHHIRNFYRFNKRNKTIEEDQKHFVLTGSYLNHWGGYAHVKSMEPSRIGSPKIKLSGLERRIRVSL